MWHNPSYLGAQLDPQLTQRLCFPPAGLQQQASAIDAMSPVSPFVLKEMQRNDDSDTEDLKDKWGFTPGAEDTLEVSHGKGGGVDS